LRLEIDRNRNNMEAFSIFIFLLAANVRVYDHLRGQSDSASRYKSAAQSDNACNLMPSN
jgi:hypothetical protein